MNFTIGVLSSITAVILIYIFRYQIGPLINVLFFNIYPKISGEYKVYFYEYTDRVVDEELEDEIGESILSSDVTNQQLLEWLKYRRKENNQNALLKIKLKQFINKVTGEIYSIEDGSVKIDESLKGRITPSRVLVLNSETLNDEHHNIGTYLLNLTNDSRIIRGTRSGLCISCGNATSDYLLLEKE